MEFDMYHCSIAVLDLERSMNFYKEALGFSELRRIEGEDGSFILVFMGSPGSSAQIELTWNRGREKPYDLGENETHIGFRAEDIEAAHILHEKMGCICFENEAMSLYFIEDPDGHWLEIVPVR